MRHISDLHIHSKYSRACSTSLDIKNLEKYARIKGVDLLGTGDFQHPEWNKELKNNLTEDETGILRTKSGFPFVLSSELSLIYSDNGKGRKVHNVIFAKNFDVVEQITEALLKRGRIDYDGRPIFGIPCPEFTEMIKEIDDDIEVIPAHIWTPWFAMLGSKSGFDSVEECFKDQSKHIHAVETGLSSDPEMNWRVSSLDKYSLVSFSDLHSFWPWRLGREATVFDFKELNYGNILNALKTREGLAETIEVDPAYGKYHFDGHRSCNITLSPKESMKINSICPMCKKELTIGVDHRVEELADRSIGYRPKDAVPYRKLIPLSDLITGVHKVGIATKKQWSIYNSLQDAFGNEMKILLETPAQDLARVVDEKLVSAIIANREQKIRVVPGYDGVYGVPVLDDNQEFVEQKVEDMQPVRKKIQTGLDEFF
ncbi:MAG: endonuclease Q family protein [Nanoarchaeota archaeon]|nr:endonuclease Q family protein [Nanoarchaeota archaeon]